MKSLKPNFRKQDAFEREGKDLWFATFLWICIMCGAFVAGMLASELNLI